MSPATEPSAATSTGTYGWARRYLGRGLRFTLHLLEMVVAMIAGMAVLGMAIWQLGEPPGYSDLLVRYGLMGAFMSVPMVAWMSYRGHPWSDGLEMTAAMLVPMFALVLSHVAMIGGMAALMLYRFDRYTHGPHGHHA
jgi:flagellar biosynthetic protein FliP